MSVKFIHRRYLVEPTEQDKKAGHVVSLSCKGGITIAYIWDETKKQIKLAVARCCMSDNFNRRIARDIALGRLQSTRKNRNETINLDGVPDLTPQAVEDIVWGWLENKERVWDAPIVNHSIH